MVQVPVPVLRRPSGARLLVHCWTLTSVLELVLSLRLRPGSAKMWALEWRKSVEAWRWAQPWSPCGEIFRGIR